MDKNKSSTNTDATLELCDTITAPLDTQELCEAIVAEIELDVCISAFL